MLIRGTCSVILASATAMSPFGALLPVKTEHRESRGGKVDAENQFSYAGFKKFGASSDIKFDAVDRPDK